MAGSPSTTAARTAAAGRPARPTDTASARDPPVKDATRERGTAATRPAALTPGRAAIRTLVSGIRVNVTASARKPKESTAHRSLTVMTIFIHRNVIEEQNKKTDNLTKSQLIATVIIAGYRCISSFLSIILYSICATRVSYIRDICT